MEKEIRGGRVGGLMVVHVRDGSLSEVKEVDGLQGKGYGPWCGRVAGKDEWCEGLRDALLHIGEASGSETGGQSVEMEGCHGRDYEFRNGALGHVAGRLESFTHEGLEVWAVVGDGVRGHGRRALESEVRWRTMVRLSCPCRFAHFPVAQRERCGRADSRNPEGGVHLRACCSVCSIHVLRYRGRGGAAREPLDSRPPEDGFHGRARGAVGRNVISRYRRVGQTRSGSLEWLALWPSGHGSPCSLTSLFESGSLPRWTGL